MRNTKGLARRTKLGWQLYNVRGLIRRQMEKIRFINDELTLVALEELMKCEQILFRIETGLHNKKLQMIEQDTTDEDELTSIRSPPSRD